MERGESGTLARGVSGATIKWVALATMLVDHTCAATVDWALRYLRAGRSHDLLVVADYMLHGVGRLSFPLYVFLLVEGFAHTCSRARYLGRLSVFALLSEVPFDLALFVWPSQFAKGVLWETSHQNVFFTLALGLAAIWVIEALLPAETPSPGDTRSQSKELVARSFVALMAVGAACATAHVLKTDYSWQGVLAIVAAYLTRRAGQRRLEIVAMMAPLTLFSPYELLGLLDYPLLSRYDGTRGKAPGKWLFYGSYPVHLLALAALRMLS